MNSNTPCFVAIFERDGSHYLAVREFDDKFIKTPESITSEQAHRAITRQAVLALNLQLISATKDEIKFLKAHGILGARAPSCSMLKAVDMMELLKAFGKLRIAERLRLALLVPPSFPEKSGFLMVPAGDPDTLPQDAPPRPRKMSAQKRKFVMDPGFSPDIFIPNKKPATTGDEFVNDLWDSSATDDDASGSCAIKREMRTPPACSTTPHSPSAAPALGCDATSKEFFGPISGSRSHKYICSCCDIKTNNKKDFNKHLSTSKHRVSYARVKEYYREKEENLLVKRLSFSPQYQQVYSPAGGPQQFVAVQSPVGSCYPGQTYYSPVHSFMPAPPGHPQGEQFMPAPYMGYCPQPQQFFQLQQPVMHYQGPPALEDFQAVAPPSLVKKESLPTPFPPSVPIASNPVMPASNPVMPASIQVNLPPPEPVSFTTGQMRTNDMMSPFAKHCSDMHLSLPTTPLTTEEFDTVSQSFTGELQETDWFFGQ